MNIWLISLFDPTPMDKSAVGRMLGLAKACVNAEHNVRHFTSTFRHRSKEHRFKESTVVSIDTNYTVEYIWSMSYRKNMLPKRFIAHADFAQRLIKRLSKLDKPDIILVALPPLSVAQEVSTWAKKENIPFVIDVIDPWPDSFIKDVPLSVKGIARIGIFPFIKKLRKALDNASAISSISREYVDWAISYKKSKRGVANQVFYPAVDYSEVQQLLSHYPERVYRESETLNIIYAGSLASSYDIHCILKAAEKCHRAYPGRTLFKIAGTGPQETLIQTYSHLPNLKYLGWLNKKELFQHYSQSDLGLIQHKNSLTQTVTYKLFSYLSAGLPVLNSLQSEMVKIIEKNHVGLNNKEGDYEQLVSNIEQFLTNTQKLIAYKNNSLALAKKSGDTKVVYERMVQFLEETVRNEHRTVYES